MLLTAAILRVVWTSLLSSTVLAVVFSVAVVGAVRAGDSRRAGRRASALAYGSLASVSVLICIGAVAYGLILMAHKG